MRFLVARNPDPDSSLPYLVRLPIDGGMILKVHDTWPRTARVFCARADAWPADAEILEDVGVLLCRRRGPAIDLVLDRPREDRSQFVITTMRGGREGIFWQTRKVVGTARPGARIPGRRASGLTELEIVIDTRERYPFRFAKQQATTSRAALIAGDYAVRRSDGSIIAVVERKALDDLSEFVVGIVVQPVRQAEARPQRCRQHPGAGRCANEGKAWQIDLDGSRGRAGVDDDVEPEILHRGVEVFLNGGVEAVDFVDE